MRITYLGHSCFLLDTLGHSVLIDPFISGNPKAADIDIESIGADFILLTHGHGDHVSDLGQIGKREKAFVISNYEIVTWASEQFGLEGHGMNHGGSYTFDFGRVKYVNAVHSSTLPDWTPGGNPGGFVIWNDEGCLYLAGDTAATMDMKLIPMTCPPLDLAILPIGDNFTMGYEEAVIAADLVECDRVVGCHYDTFPPIVIDRKKALDAFAAAGKELILMEIGSTMDI